MSAVTHLPSRPETPVAAEVAHRRHLHLVPQPPMQAAVVPASFARRRFAVILVVLVVIAGAVTAGRAMAASSDESHDVVVTVQQGETLSLIAARELPASPTAQAVVAIQQANHLGSEGVTAGSRLVIPHD